MSDDDLIHFKGLGEWRSQARQVEDEQPDEPDDTEENPEK